MLVPFPITFFFEGIQRDRGPVVDAATIAESGANSVEVVITNHSMSGGESVSAFEQWQAPFATDKRKPKILNTDSATISESGSNSVAIVVTSYSMSGGESISTSEEWVTPIHTDTRGPGPNVSSVFDASYCTPVNDPFGTATFGATVNWIPDNVHRVRIEWSSNNSTWFTVTDVDQFTGSYTDYSRATLGANYYRLVYVNGSGGAVSLYGTEQSIFITNPCTGGDGV